MIQRKFVGLMLLMLISAGSMAQRLQQPMGRSVVVTFRKSTERKVTSSGGNGYLVSWRKLAQEPEGTTYNLYRRNVGETDYTKVNAEPLKVTNYKPSSVATNTEWAVTAITPDGVEGPLSKPFLYKTQPWSNVWFKFDFDNQLIARNDYRTKYVWPMDLDGDGEMDAVVCDRLYAGAEMGDEAEDRRDNTAAISHKIQAYMLDGTLLWTVDMGPNMNICGGQNDMVVAYDINCDGRCEVIIKSSDGTRFWDKQQETWGKYAMGSDTPDVDGDGIVDYRTQNVRNRPFYVSVIDGMTGAEIACNELEYSEVHDGVDTYTRDNRSDYMSDGYSAMDGHFSICYLDGIHPSLVMECLDRETNKTHHNYVFSWDYDWTSGVPTNWHHSSTWSRNDKQPWPAEFHQLRVADVNGDGCDEMVQGGYSVNPLRGTFVSAGIGHGDRHILSDIDPDRPGLEVFAIQQSALLGQLTYDAATGEHIKEWYLPSVTDVGRGACLDIDDTHKGYEILSWVDEFVYNCKGEKTGQTRTGSMFEGIWWDGRLQREWLNSPGGSGWGTNLMVTRVLGDRLCEFSQESAWATHAATGTRPAFMGDITGDWREEVILISQNDESSTGVVGYTTNIPTNYSIYALQQDPHYRGDCTTRGYYQHPNTGFYLGGDMPMPPLPPVMVTDLRWKGGSWQNGFTSFDMKSEQAYADGKSLVFDLSGDNSQPIDIVSMQHPGDVYLMTPLGHGYVFGGDGALGGTMTLTKSMQGTATFNINLAHTGKTIISEGTLVVNGTISSPVELRARGTLSGQVVVDDTITFEGALNYEGCRLKPVGVEGVINFKRNLTLPGNVYIEVEAGNGKSGHLCVDGDLNFDGNNIFTIIRSEEGLTGGRYLLAECTGTLTAATDKLKSRGLEGVNYDFEIDGKQLLLVVKDTRDAATNVLWTGAESSLWDYKAMNFDLNGATTFVPGDEVIFNENVTNRNITLNDLITTNGVVFNGGVYTFSGEGGISGEGGVTVNSGANVTFNLNNSNYTGKTIVNKGGKLTVPNFYNSGQNSAIGASTAAAGNLQLNGGTLVLTKDNMSTDRIVSLSDTATIQVTQANSSLSLNGQVQGSEGYLVKEGAGQLNFNYAGANNFAGVIVKNGTIAQGAWNATFGRSGSPMVLAGGEVHQLDVNSTSTVPNLNHAFTVEAGTTNRILGSSRGKISGSFKGTGNLTIETRYVRCDVGASFANFEGTLTAKGAGGNFRLMSSVTDMSKTRLVISADTHVAHYASGGGSEASATTKIGSLSSESSATNGVLGGGSSAYQIGYLNENTTFYGLLKASRITKVGSGKLTLRTLGHTSPMYVSGGILELQNSAASAMTSALITVQNGGCLLGDGMTSGVVIQKGGVITGGLESTPTGSISIGGKLTLQAGATILVRLDNTTGNSIIAAKSAIKHNNDTILIRVPDGRRLNADDELTIFSQGFTSSSGDFIVKCEAEDGSIYEFDSSTLHEDGKLRVTSVASGIGFIPADDALVDVYSVEGTLVRSDVPFRQALEGLSSGIYIVGGIKMVK